MKKISSKIMIVIIGCSLFISLWLGSTSTFQSSKVIKKEIHDKLIFMSQSYANEFSQTLKKVEGATGALSSNVFAMFEIEKFKEDKNYVKAYQKMIEPVIKRMAETSDGIQAVYFTLNPELTGEVYEIWYADKEGNGVLEKLDPDPDIKDPYIEYFYPENEEMHWYYDPIKKGKGVWSDPYEETDLNKDIISYTQPIFKDDILIGVVGMDIDIDAIKNTTQNMKVYTTGYAFLMNNHHDVLIHPVYTKEDNLKNVENNSLKFITEAIDKKNSGATAYKLKGQDEQVIGYAPLSNGWILGCVVPKDEIFRPMDNLICIIFILTFLGIALSIMVAIIFANSVSKSLMKENRKKDAVMIYQARHARMGQMIGNISHQWKQPLNNLNLILSNIKDAYIYDELSEGYLESSIDKSKKIINQMAQTIDDFRNFFKPCKNKEKFALYNTIRFVLELIEESIKRNNIRIKIDLIDDVMIYGYSNEFSQVLFNILNNAKDALIESNIKNKKIEIKIYSQNNMAIVKICNNGGCIKENILDKIFEPYFTTKTEEKGTGIGLYMAKIIIENHMNGKIEFQNIENGVCCKILIPNDGVNDDGE